MQQLHCFSQGDIYVELDFYETKHHNIIINFLWVLPRSVVVMKSRVVFQ